MTYSYTQISQYLTCPRRYRYRYLDGWKEKDTRAPVVFGRVFEVALGAFFRREDPGARRTCLPRNAARLRRQHHTDRFVVAERLCARHLVPAQPNAPSLFIQCTAHFPVEEAPKNLRRETGDAVLI